MSGGANGAGIGRRRFALLAGACAVALAARPVRAASLPPAAQPIAELNAALLAAMKAGPTQPFAARAAALRPVVEKVFDLPLILRESVGSPWHGFSAEAQAALLEAFTRFTVASWVANFNSYNGERFTVSPKLRAVGADRVVESQIIPTDGKPTRLDYQMRDTKDGWKAVDVLVDGAISRVATQRSDFRALVASGNPDKLLATLQRKARALAAGGNG